jgi:hypothetical protein
MVFYHKGLRVRKTLLPFVACARKAAMLRVQIWSAHESDVGGLLGAAPVEELDPDIRTRDFQRSIEVPF